MQESQHALCVDDDASAMLARPDAQRDGPLAAEVWVFDAELSHILMVDHRWRGWVPPGGKVEPGETQRMAALREVFEETGVQVDLLERPAAVTVRSYRSGWSATLGISFMAVADRRTPLMPEEGQAVAWLPLDEPWQGWFARDRRRMRQCAAWISEHANGPRTLKQSAGPVTEDAQPLRVSISEVSCGTTSKRSPTTP
ncbi:NUDIX hydrolase [Streptomyces sp. TRM66268-LWL]|uniref:NUDIX hydrolase n=2 Tax=Streptomyces polyasparticus TaxID=2767826 RepID=A0ABR7SME2_9ACTN|nr:NUDIX hydrolase [Streptomyces polyasparticus]